MQKKLIALAVAALASGAAFAQSNVEVYGSIDMGVTQRSGDDDSVLSIDSGISAGNRLGFKGAEDLGNGVKALFTIEAGYKADDGTQGQGRLFGRQVFAGLTGGFGTVIGGRLYTPHYTFLSTIDPFKAGTVGQYRNVVGLFGPSLPSTSGGTENLFDPTRVDNTVAYVSPSFEGFNVTAAYSTNALGQESADKDDDATVIALLPRYTNGPLDVGFTFHRIASKNLDNVKITNFAFGGTYDLGAVKIHAFFDRNKVSSDDAVLPDGLTQTSYMVGLSVPIGKHAIQFSYNMGKEKDSGDDGNQIALGYTYAMSKRTNFYAAFATQGGDWYQGVHDATNNAPGAHDTGIQAGIRHTF